MAPTEDHAPTTFPYFCEAEDLPGPLPTLEEIEAAETLPCLWPPAASQTEGGVPITNARSDTRSSG
jgi:hypothetical protein